MSIFNSIYVVHVSDIPSMADGTDAYTAIQEPDYFYNNGEIASLADLPQQVQDAVMGMEEYPGDDADVFVLVSW